MNGGLDANYPSHPIYFQTLARRPKYKMKCILGSLTDLFIVVDFTRHMLLPAVPSYK